MGRNVFLSLIFTVAIFHNNLYAQHFLDGTWEGNYGKNFFLVPIRKLVVNLEITNDTIVTGSSHLYYRNANEYEHYMRHGIYNPKDSSILFGEDSVIAIKPGFMSEPYTGDYIIALKVSDTMLRLKGKMMDNTPSFLSAPTTTVWLNKPISKKPVEKKDKNLERIAEIQKLIEIDKTETDSIKIELRDNAQIDGDVVSVYFNDVQIVKNQRLISEPITFYINISKGTHICNLKMVAESMGSISPCTAIMNVPTQQKNYEVSLSSSMSNNGVVQFFLKE